VTACVWGAFFTSALERVGKPYALTSAHRKVPIIYQIRGSVKTKICMDVWEKKFFLPPESKDESAFVQLV